MMSLPLARRLGPTERGEVAAALVWPMLFYELGGVGPPHPVAYFAGRNQDNPRAVVAIGSPTVEYPRCFGADRRRVSLFNYAVDEDWFGEQSALGEGAPPRRALWHPARRPDATDGGR